MREEAERVAEEERAWMMEERDEANRIMMHEWEIAEAEAMDAEQRLAEHNDYIKYEIAIIQELNLLEGQELDERWSMISDLRDEKFELKAEAEEKRAKAKSM